MQLIRTNFVRNKKVVLTNTSDYLRLTLKQTTSTPGVRYKTTFQIVKNRSYTLTLKYRSDFTLYPYLVGSNRYLWESIKENITFEEIIDNNDNTKTLTIVLLAPNNDSLVKFYLLSEASGIASGRTGFISCCAPPT